MFGYQGKLLIVDLTARRIETQSIDDSLFQKYIGGVGIAAKIVFDETSPETDPLGLDNVLVAFTGPFTGTRVPSSSRHHYAALSPQTGVLGESNVGGSWGVQLKKAGFDGVMVRGKADSSVYLWIHDGEAELRDARPIWGQDAFVSTEWLKSQSQRMSEPADYSRGN